MSRPFDLVYQWKVFDEVTATSPTSPDQENVLTTLVPGTQPQPIVKEEKEEPGTAAPPGHAHSEAGIVKANKGMILRKSVEYIR